MVLQKLLLLTALGFGLKTVPLWLICISQRCSVNTTWLCLQQGGYVYNNVVMAGRLCASRNR